MPLNHIKQSTKHRHFLSETMRVPCTVEALRMPKKSWWRSQAWGTRADSGRFQAALAATELLVFVNQIVEPDLILKHTCRCAHASRLRAAAQALESGAAPRLGRARADPGPESDVLKP